jgi:cell wall-associated NlpC family hydrolase
MSFALPNVARAGARVAFSGALAVGLLTSAPISDAHAAPASATKAAAKVSANASTTASTRARAKARARHQRLVHVHKAMRTAIAQKGDPYSYGSAGPGRFDCSGLTYYSFRRAGFKIPRTASAQSGWARHISRKSMKRGDLMFFTSGGGVYHVGVYAGRSHGKRMVLHAPNSGDHVRAQPVWTNGWFPGTLRMR